MRRPAISLRCVVDRRRAVWAADVDRARCALAALLDPRVVLAGDRVVEAQPPALAEGRRDTHLLVRAGLAEHQADAAVRAAGDVERLHLALEDRRTLLSGHPHRHRAR